jgi:hypothetical protein
VAGRAYLSLVLALIGACRFGFDDTSRGDGGNGDGGELGGEICTEHWCWERAPAPAQRALRAIRGSSATDVWAVGDGGVIRHWDGVTWSVVPSPTTDALVAIDVLGPDAVTIAGSVGRLWYYDGSSWTTLVTPSGLTAGALWRAPDLTLWAGGDLGTISVNGVPATGVPSQTATNALHGTASNNVWHAGMYNTLSRWNGATWSQMSISDFPYAVWARSDGTAFVGGGAIFSCTAALACTSVQSGASVKGMWGVSDSDVWAVGSGGKIFHWNGAAWQPSPSTTTIDLQAVWAAATDDVWAVGEGGIVLHWDGAAWTNTTGTMEPPPIYGALWVGADDDRWLGGRNGLMFHSDGGEPIEVPLPAGAAIGDEIQGVAGHLYALDTGMNRVLRYDGSSWQVDLTVAALPMGLAVTATEVLASTIAGQVHGKPSGGAWTNPYTMGGSELHALCIADSGRAMVIGRFSDAALRVSGTWTRMDAPTGRFMTSCDFAGEVAYAVGGDAVVRHDGAWTALGTTTRTTQTVNDVLAVSATEVYASGSHGRIVRFDGSMWQEEAVPHSAFVSKLARSTSGTIFAAAHGPGMLRRR